MTRSRGWFATSPRGRLPSPNWRERRRAAARGSLAERQADRFSAVQAGTFSCVREDGVPGVGGELQRLLRQGEIADERWWKRLTSARKPGPQGSRTVRAGS